MSVYDWEQGKARPRTSSIDAWTAIRRIGKREAAKRVASIDAAEPKSDSQQTPAEPRGTARPRARLNCRWRP